MLTRKVRYLRKWRKEHPDYERLRHAENPERKRAAARRWYNNHREHATAHKRRWRKSNPRQVKHVALKHYYNMSVEEYEAKLKKQKGRCAICRRLPGKRRLAVDHDHKTKKNRSLLCNLCNPGLGNFKENPALLRRAAEYLESFQ